VSTEQMECSARPALALRSQSSAPHLPRAALKAPQTPQALRAAEALAVDPKRSNLAIAKEIGVHRSTVAKARRAGRESFPPEPCIDLYAPVDPDRAREIAEASRAIGVRAVLAAAKEMLARFADAK
jgi:hypothetical protein